VSARVQLDPPSAAADARWLTVTSWQGDGFVLDRLERIGEGTYRTTKPIPVHGDWKAVVRLHRRGALEAVPIYLPADRAIPAPAVPARPSFTRSFVADRELLQREAKATSPAVTAAAYLGVLAIALALLGLMAWGLWRLAGGAGAGGPPPAGRKRVAKPLGALRPNALARSQPSG
jgi:hypothetical protein